jgi:predicted XRE-type DNA-binding protein
MNGQNEIILYKPNDKVQLEVVLNEETVWLTQEQIALLFGVQRPVISKHIGNIYSCGELDEISTCSKMEQVQIEGNRTVVRKINFYNLDAILSVGYRVNSLNATMFRRWASDVLKEYLFRGYSVNQRFMQIDDKLFQHEQKLLEHQKQIDFIVRTEIPPKEGVFYDGQIFDAFVFVADLIRSAKKRIVLIDNYLDESLLMMLAKRGAKVKATVYTKTITPSIQADLTKHNAQYPAISIEAKPLIHDRFLLIDNAVYHIGASFKDLGKRLFAFSRMEMTAGELLKNI